MAYIHLLISRGSAMSETNLQLVREMFHTIDANEWAKLGKYFTPDILYERPGYAPLKGLAALLDFYRGVRIVAAGRHELHRVVADGDAIACWGRFIGRSREDHLL